MRLRQSLKMCLSRCVCTIERERERERERKKERNREVIVVTSIGYPVSIHMFSFPLEQKPGRFNKMKLFRTRKRVGRPP